MFIQNTNSNAMLTHGSVILDSLQALHAKGFGSKAILTGFSAVILNYSINVTTKKLSPQQS
jgi:hypothetical protein